MTRNKQAKQVARAHARATGVSYTAARRVTGAGGAGTRGPGDDLNSDGEWDDFEPQSVKELLKGAPQSECDRLIGETIRPRNNQATSGIFVDFDLAQGMSEPFVDGFDVDDASTVVEVIEEYEAGTLACNVTTSGTLTVEALMAKGEAMSAEEAGEVRVYEADFNTHYSSVLFDLEVEVTFHAIVNPEYEGVEDFTFEGATVL